MKWRKSKEDKGEVKKTVEGMEKWTERLTKWNSMKKKVELKG